MRFCHLINLPLVLWIFRICTHLTSQYYSNYLSNAAGNGWVTTSAYGRLGNQMFTYCSIYGIAKKNNKKPFFRPAHLKVLMETFQSLSIPLIKQRLPFTRMKTIGSSIFTKGFMDLADHINIEIVPGDNGAGLFSYKYFYSFWKEMKSEFKFRDDVMRECQKKITSSMRYCGRQCSIIGVHLRSGDVASIFARYFGFLPARQNLVQTGIKHFEKRFGPHQCLLFLVLGNDFNWNLRNTPKNSSNVVLLKPSTPPVDFCILAHVNHSIVSTGTFGLMSALLAGGTTLYQKMQVRPKSTLAKRLKVEDYIPPNWIPI